MANRLNMGEIQAVFDVVCPLDDLVHAPHRRSRPNLFLCLAGGLDGDPGGNLIRKLSGARC